MKKLRSYNMPQWARLRLESIAKAYEITITEALLRCLDQGSKWHRKNIRATINPAFDFEPKQPGVLVENYSEYPKNVDIDEIIKITQTKWVDD